ncbi:DUF4129 domain-containing protein [Peterkaempfera bronchialis]|uniref:DUF4129 domain-containing protein n=1 Tax=Peterkaempfera bronchialis TaxID=2126346 RepID=A0A345SVP6_9ACTN|nr:DUF4129 domain-containing protein [Peterkaempfera bronchialis]AXI77801.1 DUF4129 domain-containing protein [Peterkaempfera bronchialis]
MGTWGERPHAAALGEGGVPVTVGRDAAREAARHELTDPAYHRDDPSLLERLLNWVWRQFDRMLEQVGGSALGGRTALVVFLAVLLLAGLALWWRLGAPRRAARTAGAMLFDDRRRTAAEHRAAAERHAAAAQWADAVRERMRAVVRALEERAILDERPGRTADEAAAEAGRVLPDHADPLRRAVRTFDDTTYGGRPGDAEAYQEIADLDSALQRARPASTPAPAATGSGGPA